MTGNEMDKTAIELFAGVGGFRVGLNHVDGIGPDGRAVEDGQWDFVWADQWEPSTKAQHAFDCYARRFGTEGASNEDVSLVDKSSIPDHTLLCGGFPCQDYSVARSLSGEKGIQGKKGVLWWQIRDVLAAKRPPFVLLENVDRLLKSPSTQRGRDFGIMLRCLADLGYGAEWRVINAADYGFPQRRRRTYIFAWRDDTAHGERMTDMPLHDIVAEGGLFAQQFPIAGMTEPRFAYLTEYADVADVSDRFSFGFGGAGAMVGGAVFTADAEPRGAKPLTLGDVCEPSAGEGYYLDEGRTAKFAYLRGAKKIPRLKPDGTEYIYSEGGMSPYDPMDLPGRTMLTSEGSVNRSTHIVKDSTGRLRRLTPVECERLNGFPDGWTEGMPESRRYFAMGNALVCGVVGRLGDGIGRIIDSERGAQPLL